MVGIRRPIISGVFVFVFAASASGGIIYGDRIILEDEIAGSNVASLTINTEQEFLFDFEGFAGGTLQSGSPTVVFSQSFEVTSQVAFGLDLTVSANALSGETLSSIALGGNLPSPILLSLDTLSGSSGTLTQSFAGVLDPGELYNFIAVAAVEVEPGSGEASFAATLSVTPTGGNVVPEPTSLAIFGIATLGLVGIGARRKRKQNH